MLKQTSEKFRKFFLIQFTKELIKNSQREKNNEPAKENLREKKLKNQRFLVPRNQSVPLHERTNRISLVKKNLEKRYQTGFEKINILIKYPTVVSIECDGPEKNLIVRRIGGEKRTTAIKLTAGEINQTMQKFSQQANVPINNGIFKAVLDKLIISVIISDADSKFLITKMSESYY